MTKAQRAKQLFIKTLQDAGIEQDRFGHFHAADKGTRIKIQKISWRYELRTTAGWKRLDGFNFNGTTPEVTQIIVGKLA